MANNIEFNTIRVKKPKNNWFDLSHDHKLSMRMGRLVPFYAQEVLPGDFFKIKAEAMLRMAPMIAPVMHKVDCFMHYFYVPNRILWTGWEDFITGNKSPEETPAHPYLDFLSYGITVEPSSVGNYLGLPISTDINGIDLTHVNALPFAAFHHIWHEYYRDQNLQNDENNPAFEKVILQDGAQTEFQTLVLTTDRNRAWEHDYFTSALPWAQKGEAVGIPIGMEDVELPVKLRDDLNAELGVWQKTNGSTPSVGSPSIDGAGALRDSANNPLRYDPDKTLVAQGDIMNADSLISDLRTAYALQRWLEKNARAGTRYVESILAHFGINVPDGRLQRPEYIGGSKQAVVISEVLQTAPPTESPDGSTPQGNMAGHGISVGASRNINYKCLEHGWIIGVMSVLPRTAYYQGLDRKFFKADRLDYYWQEFVNIGEQEVLNKEIYYDQSDGLNDEVFGYVPRYSEYKFNNNRVSGDFADNLKFWHMGRHFENRPLLNAQFVVSNPTKRIFAVEDEAIDDLYVHIYQKIRAQRPLPIYSNPI